MEVERRVPVVVLALVVVLGLVTGMAAVAFALRDGRSRPARDLPAVAGTEPAAARVLRDWDRRRSQAYAHADVRALAGLYADRSRAGAADQRVLRGYRKRGLRVAGMRTQVLSLRVLRTADDRITLLVTDVLEDAVAVDAAGRRWPLPGDRPTTRRVVLVRAGAAWRVAESYAVG